MRLCALFVLFLLACPPPPEPGQSLGEADGGGLFAALDGGALTLSWAGNPRVRLPLEAFQLGTVPALDDAASYDPFWLEHKDAFFQPSVPRGLRFRAPDSAKVERVDERTVRLALTYDIASATVTVSEEGPGRFIARFEPGEVREAAVAFMRVRLRASSEEAFYGLGEWFDSLNHRGKRRPMQMEADLTVESATTENHVVVPFLIGSTGWGVYVDSMRYGVLDVAAKEADLVELTFGTAAASAQGLTVHLFVAEHPLDIPARYYEATGRPGLPAPWALGPWLWRDENKDQAQVLDDLKRIKELDLATTGLWIDRPYASFVNTFDFDPGKFPDAAMMSAAIKAQGLGFALWHTPYLEEGAMALRSEAKSRGFFPSKVGAQLNRWSAPLDFTAPGAVDWWRSNLHSYLELGVRGFKLDFAEDVAGGLGGNRLEWAFTDGSDERTMHAGYTLAYHQTYMGLFPEPESSFFLVRAGRIGSHRHGLIVWPGDIDATLTRFGEKFTRGRSEVVGVGGLPSAVVAGLSLAASGFPFFAADTGGYRHSPPDKETFVRWAEQSALMPAMQTGDSSSQMPWEFLPENGRDEEALEVYRRFARLHLRLFPFFWTHAKRLPSGGRPIVRAFGLAHPELGWHGDEQYVLGDDELLVAPVLKQGARQKEVRFPKGRWVSWFSGERIEAPAEGKVVTVEAPLTSLPLFIREGAMVPMLRPSIDTWLPATEPGVDSFSNDAGPLHVRVAVGAAGEVTVYDGTRLVLGEGGVSVTPGSVFTKGVVLELMFAAQPGAVTVDGQPAQLSPNGGGGYLVLAVPEGAHEVAW